jgi:cyclohexanone monooxygenase
MLDVAGKRAGFMPAVEGGETMTPEEKVRKAQEGNIKAMMRIHSQIDEQIEDPATAEALKPQYMIGCKRPTSHAGFLPVFNQPNVSLVDTQGKGIDAINEGGILSGGVQYDLDVLIMATGFEVQQTGIWNVITGIDGLELQDKYSTGIRTLLGISSRGFPNLFIMGGYQAAFSFNLVDILKTQGDHIAKVVSACNAHGDGVVDVKADSEEWWVQQVIANRAKSSYAADCTPGYYNFEGQEQRPQDGNFNGGVIKYYDSVNAVGDALEDHFEFI